MANPKRVSQDDQGDSVELEGFDQFFVDEDGQSGGVTSESVESITYDQVEKLLDKVSELISLSVDQRIETSKISNQLLENQRQLIATQQILIKLMERSIELTRHVTSIEERLPGLFELPRVVESLRERVAQLEGVELR